MKPVYCKKYALLIGINYFNSNFELKNSHSDIDSVNNHLRKIGFREENIVVLKDDPTDIDDIFPSSPTKLNIIKNINTCISKCEENNLLYIHYSGHSDNNSVGSICPIDYYTKGNLYDDALRLLLVDNLPKGVKLRVVFDAYHNQKALNLPLTWNCHDITQSNSPSGSYKDIIFISIYKDPQFSSSQIFDIHPYGSLTWAFLKSINKIYNKKLTLMGNKNIYNWKDVLDMIRLYLKNEGYEQLPQINMMDISQLQNNIELQ